MKERNENNNKNIHGKPEISSGHDISVTSTQWFGAAFFYLANFGQVPMKKLWAPEHATRNWWVGFFLKLAFLALAVYLLWIYTVEQI